MDQQELTHTLTELQARTDATSDGFITWLLTACWPTKQAQNQ